MRYPKFRKQGLFVGSGVYMKQAEKTVIGSRLKQSGMFCHPAYEGHMLSIALRRHRLSGKFEDYWESRSRVA